MVRGSGQESYAQLLTRAVKHPSSLSAEDRARITPADKRLIIDAIDKEIRNIDLRLVGVTLKPLRVTGERRRELIRLAKAGLFNLFALPHDEQRAIEGTPGLLDEIWEAREAAGL